MAQKTNGFTLSSMLYARSLVGALLLALCSMPLAPPFSAQAQQPKKVPRIGYLSGSPASSIKARTEAFRQGLRDLGYVEGKNIVIEWRSGEGKRDHFPAVAADLVHLKVDLIVTARPLVTRAAKQATSTIPIVMAQDPDPVGNGFVASLARPGGNITGLSSLAPGLTGKQLELLKEIVPKLSRVAVFETSTRPGNAQTLREVELAAGAFGVQLQYLDVLSPKDIETAFQAAVRERADGALWFVTGSIGNPHRKKIADLAVSSRLPVIYNLPRRYLCGQDPEGHEARWFTRRTGDEVWACYQSESGQADRSNHSAKCAGESGQGDSVKSEEWAVRRKILEFRFWIEERKFMKKTFTTHAELKRQ
jgi:putative ABC transport system substrate-binding protein